MRECQTRMAALKEQECFPTRYKHVGLGDRTLREEGIVWLYRSWCPPEAGVFLCKSHSASKPSEPFGVDHTFSNIQRDLRHCFVGVAHIHLVGLFVAV